LFTSPPFPLNRKKKYGNLKGSEYQEWLAAFAPPFRKMLTPDGSIVLELGNAWDLLKPVEDSFHEINLECSSCGNYEGPDLYAEKAVASALADEAYSALKDGGESPIANCPECGEEACVMEERRCAACGNEAEHTCVRCGNEIPAEEMSSSPLCGYCEHMSSKDD